MILERKNIIKSFVVLRSLLSYELAKFWIWRKWRHTRECTKHFPPCFLFIFSLILRRMNFLQSFIIYLTIFLELIKLQSFECLDVSDVINCGLHVNFWNFCWYFFVFLMKKNHFKQKLLPWHQFPFKRTLLAC